MAVDQEQVGIAIIIIIKEPQAPAAKKLRRRTDFARLIGKRQILLVVIKTEKLLLDVGDEKVLPAVTVM